MLSKVKIFLENILHLHFSFHLEIYFKKIQSNKSLFPPPPKKNTEILTDTIHGTFFESHVFGDNTCF